MSEAAPARASPASMATDAVMTRLRLMAPPGGGSGRETGRGKCDEGPRDSSRREGGRRYSGALPSQQHEDVSGRSRSPMPGWRGSGASGAEAAEGGAAEA